MFEFFCYFFGILITGRVGTHPNDFFFLSFSAFRNLFWLEKKLWWCFLIFWIFFANFYFGSGRNTLEWFFFSLFLSLSQPILAWKEARMVFSNFLNIFGIILEFSITGWVGTHQNKFFYFLSFSLFPNLFWLEMKLRWCVLIFWIFLLFFFLFSIMCRLGTHRNDFFYFLSFSGFNNLFWIQKKLWYYVIIFWIFLLFFLNFLLLVGYEHIWTIFFYFLPFSAFPNLFWIVFSNFFDFFCICFRVFYDWSGWNTTEQIFFFFFLSFSPLPNLFRLEKELRWYFLNFWIFLLFFWNFLLRVG